MGRTPRCRPLRSPECTWRRCPSDRHRSPCCRNPQNSQPAAAHSETPASQSSCSSGLQGIRSQRDIFLFNYLKNVNCEQKSVFADERTVLKAQQEPHCFWSLTSVTYPLSLQSTVVGRCVPSANRKKAEPLRGAEALKAPRQPRAMRCLYSSLCWWKGDG